jgi:galactose mutarotase-like enzyme
MYSLKNDFLKISIKQQGAELCSITAIKYKTEFLWQANPDIWGSHAPNLFPIIGSMKDDSYIYNSITYGMPKHGFARNNANFVVKNHTSTSITFQLVSNNELFAFYPFIFELNITYSLSEQRITVHHRIKNLDTKTLYFSIGGHPGFNCPLFEDEKYTDYFLEFEKTEVSESCILNRENGLVTNKTKSAFSGGNKINLHPDLFNEDALIFKDLKSRIVTLKHKTKGKVLTVKLEDFQQLGIWAKPNAPFVCIEPWLGFADNETTDQNIETKEGILKLETQAVLNASYSIEIDKSLLV